MIHLIKLRGPTLATGVAWLIPSRACVNLDVEVNWKQYQVILIVKGT